MNRSSLLLLILLLALVALGPWCIYSEFHDAYGNEGSAGKPFNAIADFNDAGAFIEHGYGEVKDIALHFITVISGILVFAITFSEKVVRLDSASVHVRLVMVSGWGLFILSIIATGIGLAFNAFALPCALSDTHSNGQGMWSAEFYEPLGSSLAALITGGYWFVLGLICIVLSGAMSVFAASEPVKEKNE